MSLRTSLLSSLVLTPLSAQESPDPYSSSSRASIAMLAEHGRTGSGIDMMSLGDPLAFPGRAAERTNGSTATECAIDLGIADPPIAVRALPEPVYVQTLSRAEISSLENEISNQVRGVDGLTLVLAGEVQTHTGRARAASGTSCVVVDSVRILPMKQVTVYVAREYPVGSCNYNAVKRHEERHVAIARALVKEYEPRLRQRVAELRLRSRGFAAWGGDKNASSGKIASDIQSAVQEVIDELVSAIKNANRQLDEADTERTLRDCAFW